MVVLWLFSGYLSTAFGTWVWPLIGFFVLPTTTLAYAVAQNRYGGVRGVGLVLVILGVLVDLGALRRRQRRGQAMDRRSLSA